MQIIAEVFIAVWGLVIFNNMAVEVLKKVFGGKVAANLLAFICGEIATISYTVFLCAQYQAPITWDLVFGSVAGGFLVSYGSMFGYDKLMQLLNQLKQNF